MKYFITFIDDYSQYGYVYLLKHKSEALKKKKFKNYKTEVKKQLKRPIKSINNDRGGEYETFDEFYKENELGIFTLCLINLNKMVLLKDTIEL